MEIILDKNNQLSCELKDPIFSKNITGLLKITDSNIKNLGSLDAIDQEVITSIGTIFQEILLKKINGSDKDLLDETSYKDIFIGTYSQEFTEILLLIKEICEYSWNLDSYSTLEIWDKGVKQEDKQNFYSSFSFLNKKLQSINEAIKNREQ